MNDYEQVGRIPQRRAPHKDTIVREFLVGATPPASNLYEPLGVAVDGWL